MGKIYEPRRSMDIGGYRDNDKGLCEMFIFPKSINKGRIR